MTEFEKYLKEARQEFCKEVNKYNVSDNLKLRTACDSFLIAFDQATEKAINYTRCCTELPNKMVIELSDEEMQIVSTDELIQMEKEAMEFDGFEGWIVRGKAAILK